MSIALQTTELTKSFGGVLAVEELSLAVEEGEIVGLIGPNGAGKTTVFNLVTGIYAPTAGGISLFGEEIAGQPPDRIVRRGLARTFQNIRLFKNLTVLDNVVIALDLNHPLYSLPQALLGNPPFVQGRVKKSERQLRRMAMEMLEQVGIGDSATHRADSLPYGAQRKLEIARALALQPRLLLLDEPAAGMNPEETAALTAMIRSLRDRFDLTILLIEHHMDLVMELCDRICVLNFGRELACGTPRQIRSDPEVLRAYLGEKS